MILLEVSEVVKLLEVESRAYIHTSNHCVYTLNLQSIIRQLYLNKTGEKRKFNLKKKEYGYQSKKGERRVIVQ